MNSWTRISAYLVPYIAVIIGMYVFKNAWLAILLYHAGIIIFLTKVKSEFSMKSVFSGWEIKTAIISILLCSLAGLILYQLESHIKIFDSDFNKTLAEMGLKGTSWLIFSIYFVTVHPVLEEMYWRGVLSNSRKSISTGDSAFGGYHILVLMFFIELPFLALAFLVLSFASWYWRTVSNSHKGLIIPILSHSVADLSVIVAANYLLTNPTLM